jgi:hypothetical protein
MVGVEETRVVVVVNENTKGVQVFEVRGLLLISILDAVHGLAAKNVLDGEVHWVVEETSQVFLIWTNVSWVTVKVLTHLEHSRCLSVLTPEIFRNFWNSIDSNSIKSVGLDKVLNPVLKVASNVVVLLIEIRKTGKTAILNRVLITPVDITVSMIVLSLIQWVDLAEVVTDWSAMVGNNVDHDVDAFSVSGLH